MNLSTTARTPDAAGSGWAEGAGRDWATIDPTSMAAARRRRPSHRMAATAIEPGLYTVVLEPAAVAQLVPAVVGSMDAAERGRGPQPVL